MDEEEEAGTDGAGFDASDFTFWYRLGLAFHHRGQPGDLDESMRAYRKAIEIRPDLHQAWYNLGNALVHLGRLYDAAQSYRKAIAIKPDDHEAWRNLGVVLRRMGRPADLAEARLAFRKAIEIRPYYN